MLELWKVRVDGGNGKEKYGEGYSDIWAINRLHFKASSPQFCDHVSYRCIPYSLPSTHASVSELCVLHKRDICTKKHVIPSSFEADRECDMKIHVELRRAMLLLTSRTKHTIL